MVGKLAWIKRQRARFQAQPRQSEREMVSGESHYFLGRRYRLRVVEHKGAGRPSARSDSWKQSRRRPCSARSSRSQVRCALRMADGRGPLPTGTFCKIENRLILSLTGGSILTFHEVG